MTRVFVTVTTAIRLWLEDRRSERGAAAVEYGMLVALIAAVVVSTAALLGPKIRTAFQAIVDALTAAGV